jgi:hypothetical protein
VERFNERQDVLAVADPSLDRRLEVVDSRKSQDARFLLDLHLSQTRRESRGHLFGRQEVFSPILCALQEALGKKGISLSGGRAWHRPGHNGGGKPPFADLCQKLRGGAKKYTVRCHLEEKEMGIRVLAAEDGKQSRKLHSFREGDISHPSQYHFLQPSGLDPAQDMTD